MALEFPEAIDHLPKEAAVVALRSGCALWSLGRYISGKTTELVGWPGTSAWRSWVGRGDARQGCIASAAQHGLQGGASGLLMTEWGDLGHRQPWPVSLFGLLEGLGAAWNAQAAASNYAALGHHAFADAQLGLWLDSVSRIDACARTSRTPRALAP